MSRRELASLARAVILLLLSLLVIGCEVFTPNPTSTVEVIARPTPRPPADPWQALEDRALSLPVVGSGQSCPTTKGAAFSADFGPGLGDGPVYPVLFGTDGTSGMVPNRNLDRDYKPVIWVINSSVYGGPVLIRGRRIDGAGDVMFDGPGDQLLDVLRLPLDPAALGSAAGFRQVQSVSWFSGAGCYAYQIDGIGFADVVVVRVHEGA